jgi:hypothetical protein
LGLLNAPPLAGFVRHLQASYGLRTLVETGTFRGASAEFAASVFPQVVTVEIKPEYHEATKARLRGLANIDFRLGDSRTELPRVVANLTGPALFWLDGHAGGGQFGPSDDCPLLEELAAIAESPFEHFVLVDDARAFLAPPPPPFDPDKWPDLAQVLETLRRRTPYYCVALEDVLICVPPTARDDLRAFCNAVRPRI